jgi:hypothetical protein
MLTYALILPPLADLEPMLEPSLLTATAKTESCRSRAIALAPLPAACRSRMFLCAPLRAVGLFCVSPFCLRRDSSPAREVKGRKSQPRHT